MSQDEGIWSTAINKPLSVTSLAGDIDGVPDTDMQTIRELTKVWRQNYPYNLLRTAYYQNTTTSKTSASPYPTASKRT